MSRFVSDAGREAINLLAKCNVTTFPTPVESVARSMGILVQSLQLDDEMSGMSFIKDDVPVIVINATHHPNRQRFTLAHELGHHVIHKEYLNNNVHVDKVVLHRDTKSKEGFDRKEIEANAFAAEILMPTSEMRKHKDVDINDEAALLALARMFKVSLSAITFRIINTS